MNWFGLGFVALFILILAVAIYLSAKWENVE